MLIPDVLIDINFFSKEKNGRSVSTPANFFSCICVIGESNHDCRLLLEKVGSISPGEFKKNVPVKFLCADLVMPKLQVGSKFFLRDGRVIAEGKVVKISNNLI